MKKLKKLVSTIVLEGIMVTGIGGSTGESSGPKEAGNYEATKIIDLSKFSTVDALFEAVIAAYGKDSEFAKELAKWGNLATASLEKLQDAKNANFVGNAVISNEELKKLTAESGSINWLHCGASALIGATAVAVIGYVSGLFGGNDSCSEGQNK